MKSLLISNCLTPLQNDIHNSPHLNISQNESKEYIITNLQKDDEEE